MKEQLGKYAENPHQAGFIEKDEEREGPSVLGTPLSVKKPGYNNYRDMDAAMEAVIEFREEKACVVVKHQTVCGAATGETLKEALEHAWYGDEVSAFGGIIGFSQEVDLETIKAFQGKHVDAIIAPSFLKPAYDWMSNKKSKANTIFVSTGALESGKLGGEPYINPFKPEIKIRGGSLSQVNDYKLILPDSIDELFEEPKQMIEENSKIEYTVGTVTDSQFSEGMEGLVEFSIKAGKHVKSNAILIAYQYEKGKYRILGAGAGQPNRQDSVMLATRKAKENLRRQFFRENGMIHAMTLDRVLAEPEYYEKLKDDVDEYIKGIMESNDVVLFTDAFFPFPDGLMRAAESGVKYIVSPGGSKQDGKVMEAADKLGVAMTFTGMRHFKH